MNKQDEELIKTWGVVITALILMCAYLDYVGMV